MSEIALFLGAGASRALGYPTTKEFMRNLTERLHDETRELNDLFIAYYDSPEIKDIEHVLEILDNVIAFDSNPYVHALFTRHIPNVPMKNIEQNWVQYVPLCKQLKEIIIKDLHNQYEFNPLSHESAIKLYPRLFETISLPIASNIFTTNYDTVIEEVSSATNLEMIDGFPYDQQRRGRFWKPKEFERKQSDSDRAFFRLFKLHGSLNWRETFNGDIECLPTEEKCQGTKKYKRNMLIYPTQRGREEEEPFRTLHKYFVDLSPVTRLFVVIGFSFRDPLINRVFRDYLETNRKHTMIVISPNPQENVNNLMGEAGELERKELLSRIYPIEGEFGKTDFYGQLRDTIGRRLRF